MSVEHTGQTSMVFAQFEHAYTCLQGINTDPKSTSWHTLHNIKSSGTFKPLCIASTGVVVHNNILPMKCSIISSIFISTDMAKYRGCLQTAQCSNVTAQRTHANKWPHGRKTTVNFSLKHILHRALSTNSALLTGTVATLAASSSLTNFNPSISLIITDVGLALK